MKKKIIFFHFAGGIGGAPISLIDLVSSINKNKFDSLIVFSEDGPIVEYSRQKGIRTKVIPLKSSFFYGAQVKIRLRMIFKLFFYFYSTIRNTRKLILKEKPDLVYLNTSVLVPVAIAIRKFKIPIFWHIREVPGPNKFIRWMHLRIINMYSARIIVVSNYVKSFFPNSNKIETIYNSVDLKKFSIDKISSKKNIRNEFSIDKKSFVISKIGDVQEQKGHYLLVKVAQKIIKIIPNVVFLIISDITSEIYKNSWKGKIKSFLNIPYDNFDKMRLMITKAGLNDHFIFTGNRGDIADLLSASDLTVFLSQKEEGFGRPLIESMFMRIPVVASDLGPTKEIIGDNSGILVKHNDVKMISDSILHLFGNNLLRQEMGDYGKARIEKKFDSFSNNKFIEGLIYKYVYK